MRTGVFQGELARASMQRQERRENKGRSRGSRLAFLRGRSDVYIVVTIVAVARRHLQKAVYQ